MLLLINLYDIKNFQSWKCWESNPGCRGAKLERYRCAMATPLLLFLIAVRRKSFFSFSSKLEEVNFQVFAAEAGNFQQEVESFSATFFARILLLEILLLYFSSSEQDQATDRSTDSIAAIVKNQNLLERCFERWAALQQLWCCSFDDIIFRVGGILTENPGQQNWGWKPLVIMRPKNGRQMTKKTNLT